MASRSAGIVFAILLVAAPSLARQSTTPKLTKSQRDALQSVVAAVDAAATSPETPNVDWQTHVLRTSDGAHYVAFTIAPPRASAPSGPLSVYVRLATRPDSEAGAFAEHSAVMEWLKGMRSDPLVSQKRTGIAFGEMPVFGAGGIANRGPGQQSGDLALLNLERQRARERKEAADKDRKAALEGTAARRAGDTVFPFEDFAVDARVFDENTALPSLSRAVTAGPGDYDLYVAWGAAASRSRPSEIQVVKRRLQLAPASGAALTLSTVILASELKTREAPYPPDQQASHPYAIGSLEIVPARSNVFTNDQRLTLAFQVINAQADAAGKPDVAIGFQLFRTLASGEQSVGLLNPQFYNPTTLPPDFDLNKGHPLFAAMAAPLVTLPRGEYRLRIAANDKVGGRSAATETSFRIVATPATLLATAPRTMPLKRELLFEPAVLREVAERLRSNGLSAGTTAALDALAGARFIDLLRQDAIEPAEQNLRTALRGIGLFVLGDPRLACTMLRQSAQASPIPAISLYRGACDAVDGHDRDALTAWEAAAAGGVAPTVAVSLIVDAHMRLGEVDRAARAAERLVANGVPNPAIIRGLAAVYVAQSREMDAVALLDPYVATHADDLDAHYVLLHALFANHVRGKGVGTTAEASARFASLAAAYIAAKGRHAAVVAEWREVVTSP